MAKDEVKAAVEQQRADAERAGELAQLITDARETSDVIPVCDNDWEIITGALRLYATVYRTPGTRQ